MIGFHDSLIPRIIQSTTNIFVFTLIKSPIRNTLHTQLFIFLMYLRRAYMVPCVDVGALYVWTKLTICGVSRHPVFFNINQFVLVSRWIIKDNLRKPWPYCLNYDASASVF